MVILGIWKPKDYIHACYLLCLHIILYWLIANWLAKFLDGCFYMTISIISWPSLHVDALQIMKFTNICHCSSWPTWKVFPKTCIGSPAEIRKWERGLFPKAPEAAFVLDPPLASDFVPNTIAMNERKLEESSESSSLRLERGILVYYNLGTKMQINKKSHNLMHWKILKEPDKSKLLLRLRQLSSVIW